MKSGMVASLAFIALAAGHATAAEKIIGFDENGSEAQRALEARLDAAVQPANLDQWMKYLASRPRHTGAEFTRESVEWIADQFRSWGYETEIETFYVLYPTPKLRLVEMIAPHHYVPTLEEPTLAEDATSGQKDEQLPIFNAFSPDGDVTAEVVFVNQGIPADYEDLERLGIDVKGKLVIAKYGGSWRGIKPKVAQEHGALGVILYSDPEDDGYYRGDDYPEGPFRQAGGAQRGSVLDMPLRPGDPLTPGYGATKDAKRLAIKDAENLVNIPVLPMSYSDALPILEALAGPVAPERWRGALPITYHVGPGPAVVHLKLEFNWDLAPAHNVIARLEGSEYPDQWVMRGNHHDAWVNGAQDPISGLVAMMEEARIVGELAKAGSPPARTILYGVWDAEEPALLGSTEWAEHHGKELQEKLVAYVNSDSNARGFLRIGGSHTLEALADQITQEVLDPRLGIPVAERVRASRILNGSDAQKKLAEASSRYHINALGSGSDYTPFLQHLGIAAMNVGYGGEGVGGSYHSIYDSYDWYTRFGDPGFAYGAAQVKTTGRITLRLANAPVVPLEFSGFLATVERYVDELEELLESKRRESATHNSRLDDGIYLAAADPDKGLAAPKRKDPVPYLSFAPIRNALGVLKTSTDLFKSASENSGELSRRESRALNGILQGAEQALTDPEGLPRRPWFRHQIYAPGFYTGYGVKTLPGPREGIEEGQYEEAEEEILDVVAALQRFAVEIDHATAVLTTSGE